MKKLLIIIMVCVISLISVTFALTETQENTIDRVITRWHARQPQNALLGRISTLLNRINDIQARARLTQTGAEVLNYIEARLVRIRDAAGGTGTVTTTTPIAPPVSNGLFPATITPLTQRETKPLLMMGGAAKPVAKLDFTVTTESMIIETVNLYTSSNQLPEYATQMALYDESGNFIDTTTVSSDVVTFDGLALERKPGSHHFIVYLLPIVSDTQIPNPPITFTIASFGLVAKGAITGSKITKTASISSNTVSTVTIAPVAINTVQFVNTWNGYRPDPFLASMQNTLGILEITTPANISRYSRDIIIDQLTVQVSDATTARTVANLLQIQRVDNGSNESLFGTVDGNTVTFMLNTKSSLSTIQQGQNAVYRFVANIQLDPTVGESVELTINNLKNGGIVYSSKERPSPITTIQQRDRTTSSPRISD